MGKALEMAQSALEKGEFPVGCILVYQGQIIASGARSGTSGSSLRPINEIDHAEIIALRQYYRINDPIVPEAAQIYCTMEPCLMCFATILLARIGTLVYAYEDAMGGGTQLNLDALAPLYRKNRITIVPDIRRKESLSLFKAFFNSDKNTYLKDSYLAQYTLSQK